MSVTSGNVGDIHCCGSWEVAMMKLLTLQAESGSRHCKRCTFIVKLLNIASFCLSDTHASPLMQVTYMSTCFEKHTHALHIGLSMSAHALYIKLEKQHNLKQDLCSRVCYRLCNNVIFLIHMYWNASVRNKLEISYFHFHSQTFKLQHHFKDICTRWQCWNI